MYRKLSVLSVDSFLLSSASACSQWYQKYIDYYKLHIILFGPPCMCLIMVLLLL